MAEEAQVPLRFSPRERQVLALRASGWSADQIGQKLQLSPYAVRVFTRNIMVKVAMHCGMEVTEQSP
jgi:DNA-binding NarL/FixJ family response regulator